MCINYKMSGVAKFVKDLLAKATKAVSGVAKTLKKKTVGGKRTRRDKTMKGGR